MKKDILSIYNVASKNDGIVRTNEVEQMGIGRYNLKEFVESGFLVRESQGIYSIPDERPDEYFLIQARSSKIIFSYGTALFFHGLSDRVPNTVDITLPQGYNASRLKKAYPMLRIHYVKPDLLAYETTKITTPQGHLVKLYTPERCICELIKKPTSVDKQIYTQAIKQYFRDDYSPRKLLKVAKAFDVEAMVRSYMEVL